MDPLAPHPPGYADENNAGRIVGVVSVFFFLALVFVSLRVYVRVFMVRAFGVDDALIIICYMSAFVTWIFYFVQIRYGLGRHANVVSLDDRIKFEQIGFYKALFSDGIAMGLLRISMAISLLRLNKDLKWYRYSLYGVIVFVVLYTIQAIVWLFTYCKPFTLWWEAQWANPFDPRCVDFTVFLNLVYWNVSCHTFTDVVLGALPVPIIWQLKMKLRQRLYVIAILNLGYVAVLMGVLKAIFMLSTGGTLDRLFDHWVEFWETLQLNIGIMAACASFLKPLLGRVLKINSSIGYSYPSDPYNRSGRTPMGGGGPGGGIGSRYATGGGRRGDRIRDEDDDGFELNSKEDLGGHGAGRNQVITRVQGAAAAARGAGVHVQELSSAEAVNAVPSDANSEEIILQKQSPPGTNGIVMTRDVSVRYTTK